MRSKHNLTSSILKDAMAVACPEDVWNEVMKARDRQMPLTPSRHGAQESIPGQILIRSNQ